MSDPITVGRYTLVEERSRPTAFFPIVNLLIKDGNEMRACVSIQLPTSPYQRALARTPRVNFDDDADLAEILSRALQRAAEIVRSL